MFSVDAYSPDTDTSSTMSALSTQLGYDDPFRPRIVYKRVTEGLVSEDDEIVYPKKGTKTSCSVIARPRKVLLAERHVDSVANTPSHAPLAPTMRSGFKDLAAQSHGPARPEPLQFANTMSQEDSQSQEMIEEHPKEIGAKGGNIGGGLLLSNGSAIGEIAVVGGA